MEPKDFFSSYESLVMGGSENECLTLLESDVNRTIVKNEFAINIALFRQKEKVVEQLLRYGARVTAWNLDTAIRLDREKALKTLLKYAAEDIIKNNPLLCISQCGKKPNSRSICETVIQHGCDVNKISSDGCSPLTNAVQRRNIDVIETMLVYGAKPCQIYIGNEWINRNEGIKIKALCMPLQHAFTLPTSNIESLVKYAALQVNTEDENEVKLFFGLFNDGKARLFLKFAQTCVAEVKILKQLQLYWTKVNLLDFVVSQGDQLQLFLNDLEITIKILKILVATSLPIYKEVILIKFGRRNLLNLTKLPFMELSAFIGDANKVTLNNDCILSICNLLTDKELIYLWIVFTKI